MPFNEIVRGEKTVELRLFDEKRQKIKVGDKIVFTDNTTGETLNTTVTKLHRFNTFNELYKSLPLPIYNKIVATGIKGKLTKLNAYVKK